MIAYMFNWLFPKETDFFIYFDKQAELVVKASKALKKWVDEGVDQSYEIKAIEHDGDHVTHECIEMLHKTFITPFARDEIHRLISCLDDILDYIDEVSERLSIYKMTNMTEEAKDLVQVLHLISLEIAPILSKLHELKINHQTKEQIVKINALENRGDRIYLNALKTLFENSKDPIEIMKWKEIYDRMEDAIDGAEEVAYIVEGIILESN